MLITQDTKNKTRNLELGGGLESGDGGECVIGIEELEEQVWAKGGRIHCGRPHDCLLYTSPSPRDKRQSRMPSSA